MGAVSKVPATTSAVVGIVIIWTLQSRLVSRRSVFFIDSGTRDISIMWYEITGSPCVTYEE